MAYGSEYLNETFDGKELPIRISNLEECVRTALEENELCRNSDVYLTVYLINKLMPHMVIPGTQRSRLMSGREIQQHWIDVRALYIIREDNVKRIRAKIQNEEHKWLPTNPEVRKQRKISEEIWNIYSKFGTEEL